MTTARSTTGVETIGRAFEASKAEGRCALITYLTLGYPSEEDTLALVPALQAGGADLIELGVPYSDPVADGPTIQRASQAALQGGMTPRLGLELVGRLRDGGLSVTLVLMGYYNPIHSYGPERYVRDCVSQGVGGLIVPDLPPEEAAPLAELCRAAGVALILLVAPTTGEARLARIADMTRGFLYVVSRLGITGAGQGLDHALAQRLETVRAHAQTPFAVGFGISTPEQVRLLAPLVDGIIVGSAVVERAAQGAETLRAYVAGLRAAT